MFVLGPRDGFSERIADSLGLDFVELLREAMPDGEIRPRILYDGEITGEDVIFVDRIQRPLDPNKYLTEMLFTVKNLKGLGTEKIRLIMPYFIYARQDKIFRPGEPLSSRYMLELLKESGVSEFITVSCHLHRTEGIMNFYPALNSYNVSGFQSIGRYLRNVDLDDPLILGPDTESGKWAREVAVLLNLPENYDNLKKERDYDTGKIAVKSSLPDLSGRDVVVVDDIASTGGTLVEAIKKSREAGARRVFCIVVHPVLIKDCLDRVGKESDAFLGCDTIPSDISKISVTDEIVSHLKGV